MHKELQWLKHAAAFQPVVRQTLYESSVAFGMRKALMTEQGKGEMESHIGQMEGSVKDLERQVRQTPQQLARAKQQLLTKLQHIFSQHCNRLACCNFAAAALRVPCKAGYPAPVQQQPGSARHSKHHCCCCCCCTTASSAVQPWYCCGCHCLTGLICRCPALLLAAAGAGVEAQV